MSSWVRKCGAGTSSQEVVTFEKLTVYFTEEELDPGQRTLHQKVMEENLEILFSLGSTSFEGSHSQPLTCRQKRSEMSMHSSSSAWKMEQEHLTMARS
uniref:KRAB domain-containing protein n=1 Tax=Anolis carolinensis TaxID=28377 RepID=A0A803TS43_ANOCA